MHIQIWVILVSSPNSPYRWSQCGPKDRFQYGLHDWFQYNYSPHNWFQYGPHDWFQHSPHARSVTAWLTKPPEPVSGKQFQDVQHRSGEAAVEAGSSLVCQQCNVSWLSRRQPRCNITKNAMTTLQLLHAIRLLSSLSLAQMITHFMCLKLTKHLSLKPNLPLRVQFPIWPTVRMWNMRAATTVMDSPTKHRKEMSSGYPLLGELERSKKCTLTLTAVKVKWICVMLQTCGVP